MPSQSNKLYKRVRETSDHSEQRMSSFRKRTDSPRGLSTREEWQRVPEEPQLVVVFVRAVTQTRIIIPAAESIISRGHNHPFRVDLNNYPDSICTRTKTLTR